MLLRLIRKPRQTPGRGVGLALPEGPEPTFAGLGWQLCTTAQTRTRLLEWCDVIGRRPDGQRRKVWNTATRCRG